MIHPTLQITEELYIHAAREAVWARFCRLGDWPRWMPGVSQATWVTGDHWQEGARFTVQQQHSGIQETVHYVIRMAVPADTGVWERLEGGAPIVYSIHVADQVGGCKVRLRCTWHGWGTLLRRLNRAYEAERLRAILAGLKEAIERDGPRR
ncbi:MAG: SRPBCC family protein [Caldilineaceae bacterium]